MIEKVKKFNKVKVRIFLKRSSIKTVRQGRKKEYSVSLTSLLLVQRSNFESSAQTKKPHLVGAMSVQRERERETAEKCVLSVMEQHALVQ